MWDGFVLWEAYGDAKVEGRGEVWRNCFKLLFPDVLNYLLLSSLWNSQYLLYTSWKYYLGVAVSEGICLSLWIELLKESSLCSTRLTGADCHPCVEGQWFFVVKHCDGVCNVKTLVQLSPEVAAWRMGALVPAECKPCAPAHTNFVPVPFRFTASWTESQIQKMNGNMLRW